MLSDFICFLVASNDLIEKDFLTLWNQVSDSIKNEANAKCFTAKLTRNWQVISCK